jgi:hypothetical protein
VDILEGVNDAGPNSVTLHTSAGCTMPANRAMLGYAFRQSKKRPNANDNLSISTTKQTDCNSAVNGNAGCGVAAKSALSYGPAFNKAGGGWYVLERTPTELRVWFWSRGDGSVPADVKNGAQNVDTSKFGTPSADFPSTSCDLKSHFGAHNIIINLTLCKSYILASRVTS